LRRTWGLPYEPREWQAAVKRMSDFGPKAANLRPRLLSISKGPSASRPDALRTVTWRGRPW